MHTYIFDSQGRRIATIRGKSNRVMRCIERLRKKGIQGEITAVTLPKEQREKQRNHLFDSTGFGIHTFCADWEYYKQTRLEKDYLYDEEIEKLLKE